MQDITGTPDHLDSRDIEERITEIEDEFEFSEFDSEDDFTQHLADTDEEIAQEYKELTDLRTDVQGYANEGWQYGVILVRSDYADGDWAKERAADFGMLDIGGVHEGGSYFDRIETVANQWPFTHIDWDAAADALHEDAAEFDFRGATYFEN